MSLPLRMLDERWEHLHLHHRINLHETTRTAAVVIYDLLFIYLSGLLAITCFFLQLYKHDSWLVLLSGTSGKIGSDWLFETKFWHILKNLKDPFLPDHNPFQGTRTSSDTMTKPTWEIRTRTCSDTRSKVSQNPVTPNKPYPISRPWTS